MSNAGEDVKLSPPSRTLPMVNEQRDGGGEPFYDDFDDCCWNCGGEGFVYGCSWEWQCDTWDGDSCLCTRPCHICHPPKDNPEMRKLMADLLAPQSPQGDDQ